MIFKQNYAQDLKTKKPSYNVELRSVQGQEGKEDKLTLCVVDSVGRGSRVSSNAVLGRKPRWDRPTRRGGGEPQRGSGARKWGRIL